MNANSFRSAVFLLPLAVSMFCAGQAHAGIAPVAGAIQAQSGRQDPVERIKLYQGYLEARIDKIKEIGSNPQSEDSRNELRAKYEEFTRLADELQDNLDTFNATHADIRKALKDLVSDSEKWPEVLNKATADQSYGFSRQTALEAAKSTLQVAKKLYEEQKQYFAEHKDEAGKNGTGPG